jgi:hypothetical protein
VDRQLPDPDQRPTVRVADARPEHAGVRGRRRRVPDGRRDRAGRLVRRLAPGHRPLRRRRHDARDRRHGGRHRRPDRCRQAGPVRGQRRPQRRDPGGGHQTTAGPRPRGRRADLPGRADRRRTGRRPDRPGRAGARLRPVHPTGRVREPRHQPVGHRRPGGHRPVPPAGDHPTCVGAGAGPVHRGRRGGRQGTGPQRAAGRRVRL